MRIAARGTVFYLPWPKTGDMTDQRYPMPRIVCVKPHSYQPSKAEPEEPVIINTALECRVVR